MIFMKNRASSRFQPIKIGIRILIKNGCGYFKYFKNGIRFYFNQRSAAGRLFLLNE
jgi:hypothetical protein